MWNQSNDTNEFVYKTETDSQILKTNYGSFLAAPQVVTAVARIRPQALDLSQAAGMTKNINKIKKENKL